MVAGLQWIFAVFGKNLAKLFHLNVKNHREGRYKLEPFKQALYKGVTFIVFPALKFFAPAAAIGGSVGGNSGPFRLCQFAVFSGDSTLSSAFKFIPVFDNGDDAG